MSNEKSITRSAIELVISTVWQSQKRGETLDGYSERRRGSIESAAIEIEKLTHPEAYQLDLTAIELNTLLGLLERNQTEYTQTLLEKTRAEFKKLDDRIHGRTE